MIYFVEVLCCFTLQCLAFGALCPMTHFTLTQFVSSTAIVPTGTIAQDNAIRCSHWLGNAIQCSHRLASAIALAPAYIMECLFENWTVLWAVSLWRVSFLRDSLLSSQLLNIVEVENQNGELLVDSSIARRMTASVEQDRLERMLTRRTHHWYYTFLMHWVLFRWAEKEEVVNNGRLEPCGQWRISTTATV